MVIMCGVAIAVRPHDLYSSTELAEGMLPDCAQSRAPTVLTQQLMPSAVGQSVTGLKVKTVSVLQFL